MTMALMSLCNSASGSVTEPRAPLTMQVPAVPTPFLADWSQTGMALTSLVLKGARSSHLAPDTLPCFQRGFELPPVLSPQYNAMHREEQGFRS